MKYILKISLYGVAKCVGRFKRICTLTWYSSDNHWRITAIVINRINQKLESRDTLAALLDEVFKAQLLSTAILYDKKQYDITQILCMITCAEINHPARYDMDEYRVGQHVHSLLHEIYPTKREAFNGEADRLIQEVVGLFELFYAPPTLIKTPSVSWRIDLYFTNDRSYKGLTMEMSRLMGIVFDPSEYESLQGLKIYIGRLGDFVVCRTQAAVLFVMEQRLKDYIASSKRRGRPECLPSILYGYTNSSIKDVVGKYQSVKTYEALNKKTRSMFDLTYVFNDYDKTDARNYSRVLYDMITHKILPIYAK